MATTRRDFLKAASVTGLALGFRLDAAPADAPAALLRPNAWLKVGLDGRVQVTVGKSEMGQGVRTSLPMIVADELGADWTRVDLVQAEPGPEFKHLGTGGSYSIQGLWKPLREAAAAAREMLTQAAATGWGVDPGTCAAEKGEIVHAGSGRRAPFGALVAEASRLPVPKEPRLSGPHTLLGQPTKRFDGPRIVDGTAVYGLDVKLPGMKYAAVVHCPVFGGKAASWNEARVKALPGVRAVVPLDSALAVVADSTHQALSALDALAVVWDEGPHKAFSTDGFRKVLAGLAAGTEGEAARVAGDPAGALAGAEERLSALYEFPWQAHATLEPPNCAAHVKKDSCEIWTGSQSPNDLQDRASRLLGLAPEKVRVHVTLLGGGFGRRLNSDFALEALRISRAIQGPVQVVWNRKEDLVHDHYHPMSLHRMEAGLSKGKLTAFTHRVAAPSILRSWSEGKRSEGILEAETNGAADVPYRVPNLRVDYAEAPCHVPLGWWRSIEAVPNVYARECFLDETAAAAGKDPCQWRRELLGEDRILEVGETKVDTGRLRRVLERVAEKSNWGSPLPPGQGRGLALSAFDGRTYIAMVAEVSVAPGGAWKVLRVVTVADCGLVVNPLGASGQIESGITWGLSALRTQITFKGGQVEQNSFSDLPVWQMADAPRVDVHFMDSKDSPTGLGEPPVPLVIPAVLNAVFAATGKRIRRLPLQIP